jgi:hypothetical protein
MAISPDHPLEELLDPVADQQGVRTAGQALLAALVPVPKGIRLLGLGLHNLAIASTSRSSSDSQFRSVVI